MPSISPLRLVPVLLAVAALGLGVPPALATPPGDPDLSFGGAGRVTIDFSGSEHGRAVLVQADGKIVGGGTRLIAENIDFALARYEADGTLDLGFGTNGRVTTDFGATDDVLLELLQEPDGKIVAFGRDNFKVLLARYHPDGSLDATFGSGGKVEVGPQLFAADVVRQSDGKLVVAGGRSGNTLGEYDFFVVRIETDGSLDPTFGSGGTVTTNFPDNLQDGAFGVALQPDGKIVAAGYTVKADHTTDLALVRYEADGSLDGSFGSGGLLLSDFGEYDLLYDVAVQADGKIVAAGVAALDGSLIRYLPDGSLDASFGSGGRVAPPVGGFVTSVLIDSTGAFVLGVDNVAPPAGLARLRADGSLDASFGVGGLVPLFLETALSTQERDFGVTLQPDGRIVVAGTPANVDDLEVARYFGDHVLACPAAPALGCKTPTAPARSTLQIDLRHDKRKLDWRWRRGDATTAAEVGDPTAGDDYALCIYDESGPAVLASEMLAPSAGVCAGSPCWRPKSGGRRFAYADAEGTPLGLVKLEIKQGGVGKADLQARAAGDNLTLPFLPSALPLRIQLHGTTGACWEAVFSSAGIRRNDGTRLQAQSD